MTRLEAPHLMAAMIILGLIASLVILRTPEAIKDIVNPVVTAIGMLGMKLLETNNKA